MTLFTVPVFAAGALIVSSLSAQPPVHKLTQPVATPKEAFSSIIGVTELSGQRVLVADDREGRLTILDLAKGSSRNIGRTGAGPGEYRGIGSILPRRSGGAYLVDFANRRLLPIRDDGTFEQTISFPTSIMMKGIDDSGRVFGDAFMPRSSGGVRNDSMFILRWMPNTQQVDTVLTYNALLSASVAGAGGKIKAFAPTDTWMPLANGDIMLIDARTYHVTILRDGKPLHRTAVRWTPLRFTAAERDAFEQKIAAQPTRTMGTGGGGAAGRSPQFEYPDFYPPFGGAGLGGLYTHRALNGHVWLQRVITAADPIPKYDVLDARGTLLARVELPPRSRVIGVGRGVVYVAQRDADDLERVVVFKAPI
jgi:hypothetical protein